MASAPICSGPFARHLNAQLRPASELAHTPPPAAPIQIRSASAGLQTSAVQPANVGWPGELPDCRRHHGRRHRALHAPPHRLQLFQRRLSHWPGNAGAEPGRAVLVQGRAGRRRAGWALLARARPQADDCVRRIVCRCADVGAPDPGVSRAAGVGPGTRQDQVSRECLVSSAPVSTSRSPLLPRSSPDRSLRIANVIPQERRGFLRPSLLGQGKKLVVLALRPLLA